MTKSVGEIAEGKLKKDAFSQWLGIEKISDGKGESVLRITVRKDMLNAFDVAHGGITYSLADSALALASNSYGNKAMSVETSISHNEKVFERDILETRVEELSRSNKIASYLVYIENQNKKIVALFKGTVYITNKEW